MKKAALAVAIAAAAFGSALAQESGKGAVYDVGETAGMLAWAEQRCPGRISDEAKTAFTMGVAFDKALFQGAYLIAISKMEEMAKGADLDRVCAAFEAGYGPNGTIAAGAWERPAEPPTGARGEVLGWIERKE
jgi:hypothetical protein